jgi:hypothetical protein
VKRPKPVQGFKDFIQKRRPVIDEVVHETTSGGVVWRKNDKGAIEILLIQDAKTAGLSPRAMSKKAKSPAKRRNAKSARKLACKT